MLSDHSSFGTVAGFTIRNAFPAAYCLLPTEALPSVALWLCSSETLTADPLR